MSDGQCPATLPGVGWQCERGAHSPYEHHEANRIEWWDVEPHAARMAAVFHAEHRPAPEGDTAANMLVVPLHGAPTVEVTDLSGTGWCNYCGRTVATFAGNCTRCFSRTEA